MKKTLLLILTMTALTAFGQKSFHYNKDFKKILEKTKDANDDLSYDKLLKRFNTNDTTLTDYEVLSLLIGFTNQPAFKPYKDLKTERAIKSLNSEKKYQEALDTANLFLINHPVSQQAIIEKSFALDKLGQEDSARYYLYRFRKIMQAMAFSGKDKEPYFALGPADGQNFIIKTMSASIGVMGSGSDKHGNFLDILEAKFKDGTSQNIYFIIQHATDKMFGK
ncbi:MAG TPA: DUF4919 domain-containing protein [Bacteroidia bacterium]|nr:DUF4919 domain-containing protein [Bacteroidia bacterium]